MQSTLFQTLPLSEAVLRAVADMQYAQTTEIQARTIPLLLEGKDVIGRSSTGTGKTAAFGIPAVERIRGDADVTPKVLVLSPTRELAMQISDEMRKYARYKPGVRIATVYGGQPMPIQFRQLKTANLVIGTPGRVMDHMRRGTLQLGDLSMVVLDEADEMLNMGFYEDIQTILSEAPEERQTVLFSATMPPAILKLTKEFQKDPVLVAVDKGQRTLDTIEQSFYLVPLSQKMDALNLLLQHKAPNRSVVFCNTKKMVDELVEYLDRHGFAALGLHGDMKQAVRSKVMHDFKTGRVRILVATDVAARGIDVEDVDAVFNFDIPQEFEYYIHRIGRTGRAGKTGASYTLACNRAQVRRVKEIEQFVKAPITEQPLPSREDIVNKRGEAFFAKIGRVLDEGEEGAFEVALETLNARGYSDRQVALALLAMTAGKDRRSIPVVDAPKPQPRLDDSFGSGRTYLRVNVGRNQKIAPNFIVGAIVDATGIPAKSIGKIDIFGDHTQVELNRDDAQRVMDTMQDSKIRSYKVTFTPMSGGKPRPSRSRQEGRPYPGKKARDGRRRPAEYKKGQGRSN